MLGVPIYLWVDVLKVQSDLVAVAALAVEDDPAAMFYLSRTLSPDYSSTRKIGQRRDFGIEDDPQTSRIPGASRS
jgi:hypothetical protein